MPLTINYQILSLYSVVQADSAESETEEKLLSKLLFVHIFPQVRKLRMMPVPFNSMYFIP